MKKDSIPDDPRPEYKREDLGKGVRGRYLQDYEAGHNLVLLDPEVSKVFPSEKAVNKALMSLIEVAKKTVGLTKG